MGVVLASEIAGFAEMEDADITDSEVVRHVQDALRSATRGDQDNYSLLVGVFHNPDEVALLVTTLKALSGAVSCIDNEHHMSLISAIFGMSMWNYGPDVMDALVELIVLLAASSGKYVDPCLDMLVSNFIPPHSSLEFPKLSRGLLRKHEVLDHVHSALEGISNLVPLAPSRLEEMIIHKMPYICTKEHLIVPYVESMLRLESGAMGELVGSTMVKGVMDMLIELDVKIEWEDILQDDSKCIFEMELQDGETLEDTEQEGDELPRECGRRFWGNKVAETLDSFLVLVFQHLKFCNGVGRLIQVFELLLQSFQITVLTAYKLKFSQFVMFYACSLDPEICGMRFANVLADIFTDNVFPPIKRMSAVAYLASYLSRAKFLSISLVVEILQRLVSWCLKYSETQDGYVNPKAHKVFYSGCQAIMYVLCFRMRSLMDIPRLKYQLFLMPLKSILKHRLDPFKVCLPSIVEEFLRQAKAARLFTVSETFVFDDMMESELSRAFGGIERLDMFFPFDPFLLKKSDRFIRPNFVYWRMVRTTYEDNEEGSSDEDVEDFEECDLNLDEFKYSLNKMPIAPQESLMNSLNKMSITPQESLMNCYRIEGDLSCGALQMPSRIKPSKSPDFFWCTN